MIRKVGCESDPLLLRHAKVAQLVEHVPSKHGVAGSNPVFRSNCECVAAGMPDACGKCSEPEWLRKVFGDGNQGSRVGVESPAREASADAEEGPHPPRQVVG